MALLMFFDRMRETPTQVEYRVETTVTDHNRTLVIDKQTREFQTTNSPMDGMARATAGRILHKFRTEGAWPKGGIIQS